MPPLAFDTLDVFTRTKFEGNPLAIVRIPPGVELETARLQQIAREFNLSETVFLYESDGDEDGTAQWRMRIFLTEAEIPFAGHPTIGTVCHVFENLGAREAREAKFRCNAGEIKAVYDAGEARAAIPHDVHVHTQHPVSERDVYALQPALEGCLRADASIALVSPVKGMNFVTVELPDLASLARVNPSARADATLDDEWNTGFLGSYFYVLLGDANDDDDGVMRLRTRMVSERIEDAATGSAACALASFLSLKRSVRCTRYEITQGVEMGRRSEIGVVVTLNDDLKGVHAVELSGTAVKVMSGVLDA